MSLGLRLGFSRPRMCLPWNCGCEIFLVYFLGRDADLSISTSIDSYTLLTDFYQLTMAYGYWKSQTAHHRAAFYLHFRYPPFQSGYAIACGLHAAIDFLQQFRFRESDLNYLAEMKNRSGQPMFEPAFLDYLKEMRFECDVDGIPEGTAVFSHEPLLVVEGPILQCQLLETALLNLVNFETLIATKAARVCHEAGGKVVVDFGLRRAQGIDGGLTASRAAYVGGCQGTSNVLAGKHFQIPVSGTHAHSWVMSFPSEREAFETYAHALPDNCIFLVDTYETLAGVREAIEVGKQLRAQGHEMVGIRLDSGDLAELSRGARRLLDEAGFPEAKIIASGDLDEYQIAKLHQAGAVIDLYGVGTRLVTAYDQPALGGVYKLSAIQNNSGHWQYKMKLSNSPVKMSNPGIPRVRRFQKDGELLGDVIYHRDWPPQSGDAVHDLFQPETTRELPAECESEEVVVPIFRNGELVYQRPAIEAIREKVQAQFNLLPDAAKQLESPRQIPLGLEQRLYQLRAKLIEEIEQKIQPS